MMKTISILAISLVVFAAAGGAFAQPADMHTNKIAYMGVGTSPADGSLASGLTLAEGTGLMVDYVDPASAASGRLVVNDILQKLDDQVLVSHYQLAALVRTYQPGQEVNLTLVREMRTNEVNIKLGAKPYMPLPPRGRVMGMPLSPNLRESFTNFPAFPGWVHDRLRNRSCGKPGRDGACCTKHSMQSQTTTSRGVMTMLSGDHEVTVTVDSLGRKEMTALDRSGKTIFSGPVNSQSDIDEVPSSLRDTLQQLLDLGDNVIKKSGPVYTSPGSSM
jgi:hypothetical protein